MSTEEHAVNEKIIVTEGDVQVEVTPVNGPTDHEGEMFTATCTCTWKSGKGTRTWLLAKNGPVRQHLRDKHVVPAETSVAIACVTCGGRLIVANGLGNTPNTLEHAFPLEDAADGHEPVDPDAPKRNAALVAKVKR